MKLIPLIVACMALGGCASMIMDPKTNLPSIYSGKTVRGKVHFVSALDVFYKVGPPFYLQEVVFPEHYSLDPRRLYIMATTLAGRDEFSKIDFFGGPKIMATMFGPEGDYISINIDSTTTYKEIYDSLSIGVGDVVEWVSLYPEDIETTGNGTDNRKAIYRKNYRVAKLVCKRDDKECNSDPRRGGTYGIVDPLTKKAYSPQ